MSRESEVSGDIKQLDAGGFNAKDSNTSNFQYEYKGQENAAWLPEVKVKNLQSLDSDMQINCLQ